MTDEKKQERTEKKPWAWTAWWDRDAEIGLPSKKDPNNFVGPTDYGISVRLPDGSEYTILFSREDAQVVHRLLRNMQARELQLKSLVENEQKGILQLREKYGAREEETTAEWIARLDSEMSAAQYARRNLLEERRVMAEYLGGNPTEPPIPLVKRAVEELQQLRSLVDKMTPLLSPSPAPVLPPPASRSATGEDLPVELPPSSLPSPPSGAKVRTDRGEWAICPLDQNPDGGMCQGDRCPWYVPSARGFNQGSGVRECAVAVLGRQAMSVGPLACEVLELLRAHLRAKG
ncbi:MAG: hypothetical protein WC789_06790 [Lentisphaeria bacterium]